MQSNTKRYLLVGLLLAIWLITSACSCSGLLQGASRLGKTLVSPTATPTAAPAPEGRSAPQPSPTATSPRVEAAPSPTEMTSAAPLLPEKSGQPFDVQLTQQEINDYLKDWTYEQQGVVVSDVNVRIDAERITATFDVAHEDSGIRGGVTVYGVPKVVDGKLYVEIKDFTLDDSISGFKRVVANSLIKTALEEYSTSQGIPVPVNDLEFETVQLLSEAIHITGHTR